MGGAPLSPNNNASAATSPMALELPPRELAELPDSQLMDELQNGLHNLQGMVQSNVITRVNRDDHTDQIIVSVQPVRHARGCWQRDHHVPLPLVTLVRPPLPLVTLSHLQVLLPLVTLSDHHVPLPHVMMPDLQVPLPLVTLSDLQVPLPLVMSPTSKCRSPVSRCPATQLIRVAPVCLPRRLVRRKWNTCTWSCSCRKSFSRQRSSGPRRQCSWPSWP